MKPTHPVELLVCAIAEQEGDFTPGTTPVVRNNPGDLRYAGQIGARRPDGHIGPVRKDEPVAAFDTLEHGVVALYRQIWLQVAMGQTVRQIIFQFAPPNENNTGVYVSDVLLWTGLPADVPVIHIVPPLMKLSTLAQAVVS
jgi:hypothetical protein